MDAEEQIIVVRAAMDLGVAVSAVYNGERVTLSPHMIYRRHGVPHLAALNLSRLERRKSPDRLSVFRLTGLSGLQLTQKRAQLEPQLLQLLGHIPDDVIARVSA